MIVVKDKLNAQKDSIIVAKEVDIENILMETVNSTAKNVSREAKLQIINYQLL